MFKTRKTKKSFPPLTTTKKNLFLKELYKYYMLPECIEKFETILLTICSFLKSFKLILCFFCVFLVWVGVDKSKYFVGSFSLVIWLKHPFFFLVIVATKIIVLFFLNDTGTHLRVLLYPYFFTLLFRNVILLVLLLIIII